MRKRRIPLMQPARLPCLSGFLLLAGCTLFEVAPPEEFLDRGSLLIYSPLEVEQLDAYLIPFRKAYPNIRVNYKRLSHEPLYTAVATEFKNQGSSDGDILWGVSTPYLLRMRGNGWLTPLDREAVAAYYDREAPSGIERYHDNNSPPYWVGTGILMAAICINRSRLGDKPVPRNWEDLSSPRYQGKVVMPDPAQSGVGFMLLSSLLQRQPPAGVTLSAEENGWNYFASLQANINRALDGSISYTSSGRAPCELIVDASRPEISIGVSFDEAANKAKDDFARLQPSQSVDSIYFHDAPYTILGMSLLRRARPRPAAQTFIKWAIGQEAMATYAKDTYILPFPTTQTKPLNFPSDAEKYLLDKNFEWEASNHDRLLSQWDKFRHM